MENWVCPSCGLFARDLSEQTIEEIINTDPLDLVEEDADGFYFICRCGARIDLFPYVEDGEITGFTSETVNEKMYWIGYDAGRVQTRYCSVCGKGLTGMDMVYFPENLDDRQAEQIRHLWDVDPITEFCVCEICIAGHCGHVEGRPPEKWLRDHVKAAKNKKNESDDSA